RWPRDWSSDVCSSDLPPLYGVRLSPKTQSSQTVPGATVSYDFKVVNRGIALPQDTFNLAWSSAPFAWPTSLWYANGSAVTDTNEIGRASCRERVYIGV